MSIGQKPQRAYERIIHHVKKEIFDGNLVRGQKLPPEREMAEQLGVGRNTVREGLRSLSLMGFISSAQGAGNYVTCDFKRNFEESIHFMLLMEEVDYPQISELRQGLETYAGVLASARITPAELQSLTEIVGKMAKSTNEKDSSRLDKELHHNIVKASKNAMMIQIHQGLSDSLDIFIPTMRDKIHTIAADREYLQHCHEQMVIGLASRDEGQVITAFKEHFRLVDIHLPNH